MASMAGAAPLAMQEGASAEQKALAEQIVNLATAIQNTRPGTEIAFKGWVTTNPPPNNLTAAGSRYEVTVTSPFSVELSWAQKFGHSSPFSDGDQILAVVQATPEANLAPGAGQDSRNGNAAHKIVEAQYSSTAPFVFVIQSDGNVVEIEPRFCTKVGIVDMKFLLALLEAVPAKQNSPSAGESLSETDFRGIPS
jgi:hypothetical protein